MIRISYRKTTTGYISNLFFLLGDIIFVEISSKTNEYWIKKMNDTVMTLVYAKGTSVKQIKKKIRSQLISLGVKIDVDLRYVIDLKELKK